MSAIGPYYSIIKLAAVHARPCITSFSQRQSSPGRRPRSLSARPLDFRLGRRHACRDRKFRPRTSFQLRLSPRHGGHQIQDAPTLGTCNSDVFKLKLKLRRCSDVDIDVTKVSSISRWEPERRVAGGMSNDVNLNAIEETAIRSRAGGKCCVFQQHVIAERHGRAF